MDSSYFMGQLTIKVHRKMNSYPHHPAPPGCSQQELVHQTAEIQTPRHTFMLGPFNGLLHKPLEARRRSSTRDPAASFHAQHTPAQHMSAPHDTHRFLKPLCQPAIPAQRCWPPSRQHPQHPRAQPAPPVPYGPDHTCGVQGELPASPLAVER